MMFGAGEIRRRLERMESRLDDIERQLASISREDELRRQLEDARRELDSLAQQGLHVVEELDKARRTVRELRRGKPA